MTKTPENSNDFCDMERYPAVIWVCQHSENVFKKTFEIMSSSVTK